MSVFNPLTSEYASQVLSEVGKELCLKTDMADIHFIFNSDDESIERVPAHKLILRAGSDVFRTMFNGTWKEKDEVEIVDVSADAFKEFLQFFYLGRVKLTIENVAKVMDLSNKYNVAGCLTVCCEFMKNNLNNDNVCLFYGSAILYDQQELKKTCETFIGFNTNAVLKSSGFLACDKRAFAEILKSNWLSCTEVELFEACMSWLKATGKQDNLTKELVQAQFGDSFYDIRFELMLFENIAALFSTYGHLFKHNIADIAQMIANRGLEADQTNGKRGKRDSFPWNGKQSIECNRLIYKSVSRDGRSVKRCEATLFSTNKPFLLEILTLCCIFNYQNDIITRLEDMPTEISISEIDTGTKTKVSLYNGKSSFSSSRITHVVLSVPILIRPGFMYIIRCYQTPSENCKIGGLLKTEVQMEDGINIQFHEDSDPHDCVVPRGLIYGLRFYPTGK